MNFIQRMDMTKSVGGAGMDPMSAGIGVGGQFLTEYMRARAEEEDAKRKAEAAAIQGYGNDQQAALGRLMGMYRSALMGG